MPELPEVEVVKRSLESKIQNKIIKKVKINDIKLRYKLNIKKISQLNNLKICSEHNLGAAFHAQL